MRPQSTPINAFQFGNQTITTRVFTMVPKRVGGEERGVRSEERSAISSLMTPHSPSPPYLDVTAAMDEEAAPRNPRTVRLNVIGDGAERVPVPVSVAGDDPYADVVV
jgi:hypothetical protein